MKRKASSGGYLRWFLKKIGLSAPNSRRVKFNDQASVFEFERQLLGGGGVPDGDTVALGLGPRCVAASSHAAARADAASPFSLSPASVLRRAHAHVVTADAPPRACVCARRCVGSYLSPLSEREDKDEYASSGYLPVDQRTKLLSEWQPKPAMKAALDKARPEIERLQRSRDETALSPRDQRYMPSNEQEAVMLATRDAEEAEAAVHAAASQRVARRSRATNTRGAAARLSAAAADKLALSSPIRKRRFL